ncbi:hypothetical protein L1D59_19175, partial [Pseudoalteromonas piscicida]|uniref:hypothetical protein n=1 Tax=Pseudoalteromonas piscicida TaxID=43662 RepID=UPI001EFEE609
MAYSIEVQSGHNNLECPSDLTDLLKVAFECKNFSTLDSLVVIPGSKSKSPIVFFDDCWTTKHLVRADEVYRKVNFNGLPENIKTEVKLIGIYLLWFRPTLSKLSSIIRDLENLVYIGKLLSEIGAKSFIWLDRDPIRQKFFMLLKSGKRSGTVHNYCNVLSKLCDMQQSVFGSFGFFLKTNFSLLSPTRKSNQTYCMPMRILNDYWSSYMNFFDHFNVEEGNWSKICEIIFDFDKYVKKKGVKKTSRNWAMYLDKYYQESLAKIYDDKHCATSSMVILRTAEELKQFFNRTDAGCNAYPRYYLKVELVDRFYNNLVRIGCEAIQAMTGMRVSESNCLKFGSLIEENSWIGVKTRLFKNAPEGGSIEIWAAAPYIKKIFIKIRPIAEKFFGVSGRELDEIYLKSDPRKYRSSKVVKHMKTQRKVDSYLNWSDVNDITLDEKDVHEFWVLNPNISNRVIVEKEIYVGGKWPIRSHQY